MPNLDLTPAQRYHALLFVFVGVAAAGIPLLLWAVEHANLPWYLHIPVAGLALTLQGAGGMAAGWAYYHYDQEKRKEPPVNGAEQH